MYKLIQAVTCVLLVLYIEESQCRNLNESQEYTSSDDNTYSGGNNTEDSEKIVGGYSTNIKDAPYQVYLRLQKGKEYYRCGGSILNTRHVLTAAHCLVGMERVYVRIGSTYANSGGTQYSTNSYKIHPQYNGRSKDYDVAVVKMQQAMKLDGKTSKATKLPAQDAIVHAKTELLVTGWGYTTEGGSSSNTLMAVKVPTILHNDCKKAYGQNRITTRMFCAGLPKGGKDACQGDSGGPAVDSKKVQLGVVSFGIGCARAQYPGVYTRVSSVRHWIKVNSGA